MLARFSGQTVESTMAKLPKLRYNGNFELLAGQFADVSADGDHPPADVTLDLFRSCFPIEMVKPLLEEAFST